MVSAVEESWPPIRPVASLQHVHVLDRRPRISRRRRCDRRALARPGRMLTKTGVLTVSSTINARFEPLIVIGASAEARHRERPGARHCDPARGRADYDARPWARVSCRPCLELRTAALRLVA